MDAAQASEAGQLLRRAIELRAAVHLGIRVSLDEIRAEEFRTMLIIAEELDRLDRPRQSGAEALYSLGGSAHE